LLKPVDDLGIAALINEKLYKIEIITNHVELERWNMEGLSGMKLIWDEASFG
jgi:hypothetical protein